MLKPSSPPNPDCVLWLVLFTILYALAEWDSTSKIFR